MKKIIIIGGGFCGAICAKNLEDDFEVILIDTKNYFEFTPSVLRTIVEPQHLKKIQVLHRHYLKKATFIDAHVRTVTENFVLVGKERMPYDYLIVASGSRYNAPFKEMDVVSATRGRALRDCYKRLCKSKRILIIGGGIVGVELAAEIVDHYTDKEITIVHPRDHVIHRNNMKAIKAAEKFLRKHNVNLILNERVKKRKGKTFITDKGTKIVADMPFMCTGILSNSDFLEKHFKKFLNERKQVKVNNYLQMEKHTNIFVGGDMTAIHEEKTAQSAEKAGETIVHNIKALESGGTLEEYNWGPKPMVISLGKKMGILTYKTFTWTGRIPALLKDFIEIKTMLRYR